MQKLNSRKRRRNYVKEHNLGNNKVKSVWNKTSPCGSLYNNVDNYKLNDRLANKVQHQLIMYAKRWGYKHAGSRTIKSLKLIHGYSSSTIGKVLQYMSNVK